MDQLSPADLRGLYDSEFAAYRKADWARAWRSGYVEQVRRVQEADRETWRAPAFQEGLWDAADISGIGPGQSFTLVGAYGDAELAALLLDARGSLDRLALEERGARLQSLFDEVLASVHPRYTARRPLARLVRLLATVFPRDMSCLMDAGRVFGVQRLLAARKLADLDVSAHAMSLRLANVYRRYAPY